ncbi:MAG: sugar transferase [Actinomycetota bacterium]|nr:sugar transferase [Actinomycetota bacterium]MDI6821822.1 sugar transferase [Actinomycetota bacterium]
MSRSKWLVISLIMDAILVNVGIILAFLLRFGGELPPFNFRAYTNLAIFITIIQIGTLHVYDLYNVEKIQGGWDILYAVFKAVSLSMLLTVVLTFFYRFFSFPRTVLLLSWVLVIALISGWRVLVMKVINISWPIQRVLIVGTGETGQKILRELKARSKWGYRVVGLIDRSLAKVGRRFQGVSVVGTIRDIIPIVNKYRVDRVIVTSPVRQRELIEGLAKSKETHVRVEVVPELYEIFVGKVDHTLVSDIPLVKLTKDPIPAWVSLAKRAMDIILALILLILVAPLMILVALLVKLTSPGPIFYVQERVGEDEELFKVYKFRTMIQEAEEESGPILAVERDSRITPVGRYLRRFRIDELPQLFDILKGDMSFVGPRPERSHFVKEFKKKIPGYTERFKVKPGVTGLAQISGSYATTPENKLKYDLIYIYHQSLFLDIKILLHTIKVVLTGRGAR